MKGFEAFKLFAAFVLVVIVVAIAKAEPPQCNLPNWQPVVKQSLTTQTVISTRAPIGHTHTCRNGHTWDHNANPTHNCQFCGAFQNVQDRPARPVTVAKTVQLAIMPTAPAQPVAAKQDYTAIFATYGVSAGGCANGQCSTIQTSRIRR